MRFSIVVRIGNPNLLHFPSHTDTIPWWYSFVSLLPIFAHPCDQIDLFHWETDKNLANVSGIWGYLLQFLGSFFMSIALLSFSFGKKEFKELYFFYHTFFSLKTEIRLQCPRMSYNTPPTPDIICVRNVRAIVVFGFLMK